ncbi:hypothetical protein Pyn_00029 [Prunus yedoensis var. nudiflora]|uniref:Uncharacterized protein n=1 Tax=Prunus yedoensis var. nudiflora TaxID=2094558 RepID=A0A314Z0G4_PRUYE|nr:hypothetical protein Pyn_00029 [Prunus yedoensis var. nudiflora]
MGMDPGGGMRRGGARALVANLGVVLAMNQMRLRLRPLHHTNTVSNEGLYHVVLG